MFLTLNTTLYGGHQITSGGLQMIAALTAGVAMSVTLINPWLGFSLLCFPLLVLLALWVESNRFTLPFTHLLIIVMVAEIYLNISNTLIVYHGLPSINKPMMPLVVCYAIVCLINTRTIPTSGIMAIAVAMLFYSCAGLSMFHSNYPQQVSEGLGWLRKDHLLMIGLVLLIRNQGDLRIAAIALVSSAALLSIIGLYSTTTGDVYNQVGGLSRWVFQIDGNGINDERIGGPVGDPNFFAQILIFSIPLAVYLYNAASNRLATLYFCLCTLVIVACLIATQSRGGLLALLGVSAVYLYFGGHRLSGKNIAFGLIFIPAIVLATAPYSESSTRIVHGVQSVASLIAGRPIEDEAIQGRVDEMIIATAMVRDEPLFGVGYNTYSRHYQKYSLRLGIGVRGQDRAAHSLFIESVAENGLIGLGVFVGLITSVLYACHKRRLSLRQNNPLLANLLLALFLGYVGYLFAAILLHDAFQRYFWLLTGILIAAANVGSMFTIDNAWPLKFNQQSRVLTVLSGIIK